MMFFRDFSFSAFTAGFIAVLVGFTSSAVIVFQAAHACGASDAEVASWMWALGLGMAATCIGLSLRYRVPVVTAWSTPGAAMLITGAAGLPLADAIGAFVVCAVLIALVGFTGWFAQIIDRVPIALASGMLAGILLRFGLDVFVSMQHQVALVLPMFFVWLIARRLLPRYAVILALAIGMLIAYLQGNLHLSEVPVQFAQPIFTLPHLTSIAIINVTLPLFVVTMASQNVPGVAILRANGYGDVPISPLIGWTGVANVVLAPFGAFALNLAAITAAICMGPEAHEDRQRRYVAAVSAGFFYLLVGVFGATVSGLFAAFPKELVLAIAGIALFGTIGNGLASALAKETDREAALVTFLVTASGLTLLGVGAAFWGLVAGIATLAVLRFKRGDGA